MKRGLWWFSIFFIIVLPAPLDVVAFSYAPMSLLAPLAGITLLLNSVLAPCLLKERLTKRDMLATILITFGAVITTIFGQHTNQIYDVPGMYNLISSPTTLVYLIAVGGMLVFLFVSINMATNPAYKDYKISKTVRPILAYILSLFTGLLGSFQWVTTKCASELISVTTSGENQFVYGLTYVFIILAIFLAIGQVLHINKGLSLFDATYFVPLYNAVFIIFCIITGGIFFKEVDSATATQIGLFSLGVMISLSGVLLLRKRPSTIDEPLMIDPASSMSREVIDKPKTKNRESTKQIRQNPINNPNSIPADDNIEIEALLEADAYCNTKSQPKLPKQPPKNAFVQGKKSVVTLPRKAVLPSSNRVIPEPSVRSGDVPSSDVKRFVSYV